MFSNAPLQFPSDPVGFLTSVLSTDSRDFSISRGDAVLYAVICGWDSDEEGDPEGAMDEVASRHGWSPEFVTKLRRLHAQFVALVPPPTMQQSQEMMPS